MQEQILKHFKEMTAENFEKILKQGENETVEFKKSLTKEIKNEICSFLNSSGGKIFVGVDDNNSVCGVKIDNKIRSQLQTSIEAISPRPNTVIEEIEFLGKTVLIIDCVTDERKPYMVSGSIFIRVGANSQKLTTPNEVMEFFQQANKIYWDKTSCKKFNYSNDFDNTLLENFISNAKITNALSQEQIIENLDLKDDNGYFKSGSVLFFAKNPEKYFPYIGIRCILFKGNNKRYIVDDKLFTGNLLSQYENTVNHIFTKLETRYEIEKQGFLPREEILEIPEIALKEAIINALSHRDYYEQGAIIHVEIYDNRVEITNPGGLVPQIKDFEFGTKSFSRNSLIFGLFQRINLVEKVGTGIQRIRSAMKSAELFEPEFKTKGFFTVILYRPIQFSRWLKNLEIKFSKNQIKILTEINDNKQITYPELGNRLSVSQTTIENNIRKLKDNNLLIRIGDNITGYWQINTRI